MIQPSVNWETEMTRYSIPQNDKMIYSGKIKDCNPEHTDMVSNTHTALEDGEGACRRERKQGAG